MAKEENNYINFENADDFEISSEDLSITNKKSEKTKNNPNTEYLFCEDEVQSDEEIVNKLSRLGCLTLASDGITQSYSQVGKEFYMHIFLKDISSIQLGYKSYPIFLVLAVASLSGVFGGIWDSDWFWINLGMILFFVFIYIFFVTRKYTLIITAKGGENMHETVEAGKNAKTFVERIIYLSRHKKHLNIKRTCD